MASLGELIVTVGAQISGFTDAMKEVQNTLVNLGEGATASLEHFDGIIDGLGEIAAAAGIATGAFEIAKEALENFSKAEDVQTSFALLTGSVTAAGVAFEGLKETAIQLAIPFDDLVGVAQKLAPQFGVGTQALKDVVTAAANAAAATGRSFDTIAEGLDRIAITGQVSTRQMVQFGVSMSDIADAMGVSVTEAIAKLKKGGQDAQADVDAVVTAIEAKFGGAAEKIGENLSGQFTKMKDELAFLSEDLGKALAPLASDLISALRDIEPAIKAIIDDGVKPFVAEAQALFAAIKDGAAGIGDVLSSGDTLAGVGARTGAIASTIDQIRSLAKEMEDLGGQIKDLIANINLLGEQTGVAAMFRANDQAIVGLLGDLVSLKGAFNALFPEFQTLSDLLNLVNKTLDAYQGKVSSMKDGHDALTKAMQAAKAAADPWNTAAMQLSESLMAVDKAADKAAAAAAFDAQKASAEALKQVTHDLAQADKDYAEYLKTTYVPAVLTVEDANKNAEVALNAYKAAVIAEADARQARALNPGDVALQNALAAAELVTKEAKEKNTEAIKDQTLAARDLATFTKDLQSAEDAIAASEKSAYVPAILDHATALNNIAIAEANRVTAIQAVRDAEAALVAAEPKPGDPGDPVAIKAATDALAVAKKNLAAETTSLVQANKDETTSANLLSAALKEIDADEIAALATRKLISPIMTDITVAEQNYEAALKNVRDAAEKLALAETALALAQKDTGPEATKNLAEATKTAAAARGELTVSTKGLNDATSDLSVAFKVNADTLNVLKEHADTWTQAQKDAEVAMSNLGIKSVAVLQDISDRTTAAYNVIKNDPYASVTEKVQALIRAEQDQINLAVAQGQNTVLLQAQMDGLSAALQRQKDGWVDIWTAGKRFGSDIGDAFKDIFTNIGDIGPALMDAAKTFASIIFDNKTLLDVQRILKTDLTTALKDLITGAANVGDAFKKLGTDILDIILNKIIALGIQKMLDLLAGVGGVLGSIGQALGGVIGGVVGTSGQIAALGTNTGAVTANTAAVTALTSALSASTGASAASGAGGAASGGGGLGSSVGGLLGSVTGIVGAIGSVATAIGTFVEGGAMNDKLFKILNDTDRMDLALEKNGSESIFSYTKQTWQLTSEGKDFNFGTLHPDLVNLQVFSQLTNNYLKNIQDSTAALVAGWAALSAGLSSSVPIIKTAVSTDLPVQPSTPLNTASVNTESDAELNVLNQILALMGTGIAPVLVAIDKGQEVLSRISAAVSAWAAPVESAGYDLAQQAIANTLNQMLAFMNASLAPVLTAINKSVDAVSLGIAAGQTVLQDIASTLKQTANAIVGQATVLVSVENGIESIAKNIAAIAAAPVQAQSVQQNMASALDKVVVYLGNGLAILTSTEKATELLGQLDASSLAVGQDIASSLHEATTFTKTALGSILVSLDRSGTFTGAIASGIEAIRQLASDEKSFNLGVMHPDLANLQTYSQLANSYLKNIDASTAALAAAGLSSSTPIIKTVVSTDLPVQPSSPLNTASVNTESDAELNVLNQILALMGTGIPPVLVAIQKGQEVLSKTISSAMSTWTAPAESTGYDAAQQAIANTLSQMLAFMNTSLAPILTAIARSVDAVSLGIAAGQTVLQDIASTLKQVVNAEVSLSPVLVSVENGIESIAKTVAAIAAAPVQAQSVQQTLANALDKVVAYLGNGLAILTSTEKATELLGQLDASSLAVGQDIASSLHEATTFTKTALGSILASLDRSGTFTGAIASGVEAIRQLASDEKSFNLGVLHPDLANLQAFAQLATNALKSIDVSTAASAANWVPLSRDLFSIETKLDTLNQSVAALKTAGAAPGAAAPIFKIYLNGQEMLQSFVDSLSRSGTLAPAV